MHRLRASCDDSLLVNAAQRLANDCNRKYVDMMDPDDPGSSLGQLPLEEAVRGTWFAHVSGDWDGGSWTL